MKFNFLNLSQMEDLLTTPQPSEEYKRRQTELICDTIEEMGLILTGEGKNDKQKGNKEPSPQQSDSIVENLIKDFGL